MTKSTRTHQERVADYDARGSNWLARANEYAERGNKVKAEECYAKCQYWLDKSNYVRERHSRSFCRD